MDEFMESRDYRHIGGFRIRQRIRGKGKLFFGMAVGKMKKYIYETWLPQSQYEFGGYEFEYNNEAMHAENPYAIDFMYRLTGNKSNNGI